MPNGLKFLINFVDKGMHKAWPGALEKASDHLDEFTLRSKVDIISDALVSTRPRALWSLDSFLLNPSSNSRDLEFQPR